MAGDAKPWEVDSNVVISMSARVLEAPEAPWLRLDDDFHDPDVAREYVRALEPQYGPSMVHVEVAGSGKNEVDYLDGYWFCDTLDAHYGNNFLSVPSPWSYDRQATEWSIDLPPFEAWETCEDARWMLHAAIQYGVPNKPLAAAACALARVVSDRLPPDVSGEILSVLSVVEAWTRSETHKDTVRLRARVARAYRETRGHNLEREAETAAYSAMGTAVYTSSNAVTTANLVTSLVTDAALRTSSNTSAATRALADVVRKHIQTVVFMRAIEYA